MTNREVVKKAIDYIEKNLTEDITVVEVSQEVCYSLYHFIRLFQHGTGFSPQHYIQRRRLTESVRLLSDSPMQIAHIAYEYQFGSPQSFTRAFKNLFGVSPSEVRRGKATVASFHQLLPLSECYLFNAKSDRIVPPQLIDMPEIILVGNAFFVSENQGPDDLSDQWNQFLRELPAIAYKREPECCYQLQYWSENQDLGGFYFFIGVEVDGAAPFNPLFVIKRIPSGTYLRFVHKGLSNQVVNTYNYIYNQYFPDTSYKLNLPFNFERYGEHYKGPFNNQSESEIFIPLG
ncbi:MAG TPA: AraC family transcriptional regulator [Bacteroidales bacterium]|nr:AraC family transcriptional regulator [Bacteroidales bacterium]